MHAHGETNGTHGGPDGGGGTGGGGPADGTADAGLDAFNALPADVAAARLLECLAVPRWAREIATGRPYPSAAALRDAATAAGLAMTDDEVVEALSRHPRIGERPAGPGREAGWSRSEQGGVNAGDEVLAMALRAGNREYEEKFGYVFLIRAAGRSGPEILAALNERLTHEWPQERAVVRRELTEIAVLRLAKVLSGE
jgi:2-oxo-4-hydroxy-4-carboxy-5-ureidoimidazoline decarboxylase